MAELVTALLGKLLELGIGEAQQHVSRIASVKDELRKLESELKSIQPILEDAHNKQSSSKHIKDWVSRLHDVIYDAEDVIDLYRVKTRDVDTQPGRTKVRRKLSSLSLSCRNVPFMHKISKEIKTINERLNSLYKEKDHYGLVAIAGLPVRSSQNALEMYRNRLTISSVTEPHTFGREEDEELLVELLTGKKELGNERGDRTSVIAIVGMGGLGKTTLAKKIYNNPGVKEYFHHRLWICASENPQPLDLFRQLLQELGGRESGANEIVGLNALAAEISKHLRGKMFLLVLDDVWDHSWFRDFNGVLQGGAQGSRIVITSRKENAVKIIGVNYIHKLECLSFEDSWRLFLDKSLKNGEKEEALWGVKAMAKTIVEKCKGLPLALSVVGSLLKHKERTGSQWQDVAESSFWSWKGIVDSDGENCEILSTIALSYTNLPFVLKQCLTYCAVFPKDFKMEEDMLAVLLVAEGFISEREETCVPDYLQALVDCSLIQVEITSSYNYYTLHDIVHDFGLYIRGNERIDVISLGSGDSPLRARFFSSVQDDLGHVVDSLSRHTKLRAMVFRWARPFPIEMVLQFRCLRVLDLKSNGWIQTLPEGLSDLVLLKHLSLSFTDITMLPESIGKLRNLERLDAAHTKIEILPEGIAHLLALRHLDMKGTYSLECLPRKLGRLTRLKTLNSFVVGSERMEHRGCRIGELHDLNNLRGSLCVKHLERVGCAEEAKAANLESKIGLEDLELSCAEEFEGEIGNLRMQQIYEELRPPMRLKKLKISSYGGVILPKWMQSPNYDILADIEINRCKFLEELPPMGHLPNPVKLEIFHADNVKVLDDRFHSNGRGTRFPKLETLVIMCMDNLQEWSFDASIETFPCLRKLEISFCKKLSALPDGLQLNKHQELKLVHLNELNSIPLRSLDHLRSLNLSYLPNAYPDVCWIMHDLQGARNLKTLCIRGFPELKLRTTALRSSLENMNQLESLEIAGCPMLAVCLSDELESHHFPNLRSLSIFSGWGQHYYPNYLEPVKSPVLLQLDVDSWMGDLIGLRNLGNRVCRLSISLQDGIDYLPRWIQHFQKLQLLTIFKSPELAYLPEWLNEFSFLQHVSLVDLPELRCLPDCLRSLNQLDSLSIMNCRLVNSLPEWLSELSKLRILRLYDLPELRSLPEGIRSLSSLRFLTIVRCPHLVEACRSGQYNDRISHVFHLTLK